MSLCLRPSSTRLSSWWYLLRPEGSTRFSGRTFPCPKESYLLLRTYGLPSTDQSVYLGPFFNSIVQVGMQGTGSSPLLGCKSLQHMVWESCLLSCRSDPWDIFHWTPEGLRH
jgi:hypothetical protein